MEAHKGVEAEAVQTEGAVAVDHEDAFVRVDTVNRHAEAGADAERAERAWVVPLPRLVPGQDLRGVTYDVPAVPDDDRVLVDEVRHLGAKAERVDRLHGGRRHP